MPELKIQDAKQLLKKILDNPKNYHLNAENNEITGYDDTIAFRFYKFEEKIFFEIKIDDLIFINKTGEWENAVIMLENNIRKLKKEKENQKINDAIIKLKTYLKEEKLKKLDELEEDKNILN